jgi:thioredoxin 1
MNVSLKESIVLIVVIIMMTLTAGCCAVLSNPTASTTPDTVMAGVDANLTNGPVFIEFGATWCQYCQDEKPLIEELKKEYPSVAFMDVDTDENKALPDAFYVNYIPQMDVIVAKNTNGSYLYADINGATTGDRKTSAIVGYTDKTDLKKALDAAVKARE